jgi:hypothetical protein
MTDVEQWATLAAQQAAMRDQVSDHEARLRMVETAVVSLSSLPEIVKDLESRQRDDERWRYALPLSTIAAAVAGLGALAAALAPLLEGG